VGVRRLVPESVSASETIPVQQRRLVHPQLHSHARDNDARSVVGPVADDSRTTLEKLKGLVIAGVALTLAGLVFQWLHISPIVKRIWTSSYTLYSGGLVILMLAGFYALIEWKGWRRWSFPLLVIGANSIAIYVMSWTIEHFVSSALVRHLGAAPFAIAGPTVRTGAEGSRRPDRVLADSVLDVAKENLPEDLILLVDDDRGRRRQREDLRGLQQVGILNVEQLETAERQRMLPKHGRVGMALQRG
jgi:hypothetical protein